MSDVTPAHMYEYLGDCVNIAKLRAHTGAYDRCETHKSSMSTEMFQAHRIAPISSRRQHRDNSFAQRVRVLNFQNLNLVK